MADKTLYDTLEVSRSASADTIHAAYERLAAKFDPARESNAGNPHVRFQLDAIKQAYLTLGSAEERALYDRKLELRAKVATRPIEVQESFWTVPKVIVVGLVVLGIGGFYYKHQKEQTRLEAEKVIAATKAREAAEIARAEAEKERISMLREQEQNRAARIEAQQQRNERDSAVLQYQRESQVNEMRNRGFSAADQTQAQREIAARRNEESRVKREEAQAAAASRQQLARDRAELCRLERERYGKTISC